jgi:hypothetical protein
VAHDAGHISTAILALAYTTTVAVAPQGPLSDEQMLGVSIGAGLVGGLVATLSPGNQLSLRELGLRSLASAMSAPAIVAAMLWHLELTPRLFGVVAVAGVAGLLAWPLAQLVPKMVPKLVREWLTRLSSKDDKS